MTTRIDRLTTEVHPEPEPQAPAESSDSRFEDLERLRRMQCRLRRLASRTRAEGFDD